MSLREVKIEKIILFIEFCIRIVSNAADNRKKSNKRSLEKNNSRFRRPANYNF